MQSSIRTHLWACASVLTLSGRVDAQTTVSPGFESPGLSDGVTTLAVFDADGAGSAPPRLIAGGAFAATPDGLARHLAAWDGQTWQSLGTGTDGRVGALTVFDADAGGPALASLYIAGAFVSAGGVGANRIARWDGTTFHPLGLGLDDWAGALAVFDDDGAGPRPTALYVGGDFEHAGTVSALGIARWNGSNFEALGSGVDGPVAAMVAFDGALAVGGFFTLAGGATVNHVARWSGTAWSSYGSGFDGPVHALARFDPDGTGPLPESLIAGGAFRKAGSTTVNGIARWSGSAWVALTTGIEAPRAYPSIRSLLVVNEEGHPKLYAAGLAQSAGTASAPVGSVPEAPGGQPLLAVAAWNGSTWTTLGMGVECSANESGRALAVFDDDGDGQASLVVGGHFTTAGAGSAAGVARWTGSTWARLGAGDGLGATAHALALGTTPLPGSGVAPIAVGGDFATAGTTRANRVALWDGAGWRPAGVGAAGSILDDGVRALCWVGTQLYAGGKFTSINGIGVSRVARWSGSGEWTALGGGVDGEVLALTTFDGRVIAGGSFANAGGAPANGVAAWDEATGSWSALGDGIFGSVRALLVADDGSGSALYAGGEFDKAGSTAASGVARWNGTTWTALGSGLCCGGVSALALYDGAIHAGGTIDSTGDEPVNGIARWNRVTETWSSLGDGVVGGRPTNVLALAVWNGELVAGGDFQRAGSVTTSHLARWNGSTWSDFGAGSDQSVRALLATTSGSTPTLWVGGDFQTIDGQASSRIAQVQ